MKNYYSFVYLDNDAIDTLYPQVFGDIVEKNIIHSSEEMLAASIGANLLNLLNSNVSSKENSLSSENVKMVTSTARKAQLLVKNFQGDQDKEVLNVQDFISKNQPFSESLYFVGRDTFFLSDVYNKKTGSSLFPNMFDDTRRISLDDDSVLVLETGSTAFVKEHCSEYNDDDDFYTINIAARAKYGIMMHVSNSKIKKDIRHLTWVIRRAKHFNFFVFGEMIKSSDKYYKISPYAIWQ